MTPAPFAPHALAARAPPVRSLADRALPPIVPVRPHQVEAASRALARAFHDDPFLRYVAPHDARRRAALPVAFGTLLGYAARYGAADTTPGVDGVLARVAPGGFPTRMAAMVRAGFWRLPAALGGRGFLRLVRMMAAMDRLHARAIAEPHWYFWAMGVEQEVRHHGLGARLLAHGLARADAEGLAVYGETFQPRMLPYLARLGFEVVAEADPPGGGPHLWALVRQPRPVGAPPA